MANLIVLSNRVKSPDTAKHAAGGLAVGLQNALLEQGGIWLGWNGDVNDAAAGMYARVDTGKIEYVTTAYSRLQYQHFYCGFANNTLWPAMHGRVDLVAGDAQDYQVYQAVNAQFAHQLHAMATPDTMIWVHDYHFLSVAHYCRKLGMTNRIGFFLHIPFAPKATWQQLAEITHCHELMAQLACYDVIGLQTPADQQRCVEVLMDEVALTPSLPTLDGPQALSQTPAAFRSAHTRLRHADPYNPHEVQVSCYPIGVNVPLIHETIDLYQDALPFAHLLTEKPGEQKTIIAVDRVDYSKGLPERFTAIEAFLQRYPEWQTQMQLLQIACPCRLDIPAYRDLNETVHRQVAAINAKFAQPNWQPIYCREDALDHNALMPVLRHSDICWVNSIKDGMNLVAKEYIAAQSPDNPGVLMLSKYAGAALQMPEAVIVDPLDPQSLITGLATALHMPLAERQLRYQALIAGLQRDSIRVWRETFLQDLQAVNPWPPEALATDPMTHKATVPNDPLPQVSLIATEPQSFS